ncbi:MAG: hypothetical protein ABFD89_29470 [Bryobacteraceae bacterium]
MPIRPENRHHYRTPSYREVCAIVDKRAGGRCERCGCPDRMLIMRVYGTHRCNIGPRRMYWRLAQFSGPWIDQQGRESQGRPDVWEGDQPAAYHRMKVILTHAHLNQDPADNRPENVALLCQWCHNMHDAPVRAEHARETRCEKKDQARPLIEVYRDNEGDVLIERSAGA